MLFSIICVKRLSNCLAASRNAAGFSAFADCFSEPRLAGSA